MERLFLFSTESRQLQAKLTDSSWRRLDVRRRFPRLGRRRRGYRPLDAAMRRVAAAVGRRRSRGGRVSARGRCRRRPAVVRSSANPGSSGILSPERERRARSTSVAVSLEQCLKFDARKHFWLNVSRSNTLLSERKEITEIGYTTRK